MAGSGPCLLYDHAGVSPDCGYGGTLPDGPGSGRIWIPVLTINSPASLTLFYGAYVGPTAQSAGIQYSNPSLPELRNLLELYRPKPSNNINYYDVVHALYKLLLPDQPDQISNRSAHPRRQPRYKYETAQGYYSCAPRAMGFLGMIDRAIDGHPTIWKALEQYFSYPTQLSLFQTTTAAKRRAPVRYARDGIRRALYGPHGRARSGPGLADNRMHGICTMWWRIFTILYRILLGSGK